MKSVVVVAVVVVVGIVVVVVVLRVLVVVNIYSEAYPEGGLGGLNLP